MATAKSYCNAISLTDLIKMYKKRLSMMRVNHPQSGHKCFGLCAHNRLDELQERSYAKYRK